MNTGFQKSLGTFDLTMIVIGAVIGSGIFLTPSSIVRALGDARLVMLIWVAGAFMALAGALIFAEVAHMVPKVGGIYAWFGEAYHPRVGFMYGWCMLLVMNSGSLAAICIACISYMGYFVPMSVWMQKAAAIALLTGLTVTNYVGVRPGSQLSNVFSVTKIAGIALLIAAAIFLRPSSSAPMAGTISTPDNLVAAFAVAMVGVLWSYGGWQYATFPAGEVERPARLIPRSIFIGVGIICVLYLGVNLAYLSVLPLETIAREPRVASRAAEALIGPIGGGLVAGLIAMSTFGTASVYTLAAPRIYYAMAQDGLFFAGIGRLHPRYGTPSTALLAQWCIVVVFIVSGTFDALISYVAFVDWIFYAAAAGTVFVFRRKLRGREAVYRTPGYPVVPALFILVAVWFVVYLFYNEPVKSSIGLAILLSAVPISFLWKKNRGADADGDGYG